MTFANPSLIGALGAGPLGAGGLGEGGVGDTTVPVIYPIPILEVALTDPLEPLPEWVDITQWCLRCQTTYGRQHELNQIEAQTIIASMDNMGGLFSSWNFQSAFVNLLPYIDSTWAEGQAGTWYVDPATVISGFGSSGIGSIGIGRAPGYMVTGLNSSIVDIVVLTGGSGAAVAQLVPVTANKFYTGFASVQAKTVATNATVKINWYTSAGAFISSSTSAVVSTPIGSWQKLSVTGQAPSNAAYAGIAITFPATATAAAQFFFIRPGLTKRYVDPSSGFTLDVSAWGPGGYGISPGSQLRFRASTGSDYHPIAFGYVESSIASVVDELRKGQTLNAADTFKFFANETINSSLYPGLVVLDGACLYWRFGDPLGSLTAEDFSRNGATGYITFGSAGDTATYQTTGLLNEDTDTAVTLGGSNPEIFGYAAMKNPSGITIEVLSKTNTINPGAFAGIDPLRITVGSLYATFKSAPSITWVLGATTLTAAVNPWDGTLRHLAFTYDNVTGNAVIYINGVATTSATAAAGLLNGVVTPQTKVVLDVPAVGATVTLDELSVYPSALSATQVADHYDLSAAGFTLPGGSTTSDVMILLFLLAAGFPLTSMSFEVGLSEVVVPTVTLGSSMVLAVVNQIVATEQGLLYQDRMGEFVFLNRHYAIQAIPATTVQATFENATNSPFTFLPASFQPTTDDADLWNEVPTQNQGGATLFVARDQDSIRHAGRRTLQGYTNLLNAQNADTQALGLFLLATYSTPYTRIRSIQISSAARAGEALEQMFQRDLIDLIEVIYHPQDAGDSFDEVAQIEKIEHDVTPMLWLTTWQLTPYVFGSTFWLTFNDAVLGVLTGPGSDAANRFAY